MRKKISRQKSLNASPRQISVPNIPKISLDAVRAAKTAGEMSVPKDASPRTPHSPLNSPISDQVSIIKVPYLPINAYSERSEAARRNYNAKIRNAKARRRKWRVEEAS
jgi:hypothetical protein